MVKVYACMLASEQPLYLSRTHSRVEFLNTGYRSLPTPCS